MKESLVTLEDLLNRLKAVSGRDAKSLENLRYGAARLARALGRPSTMECPITAIPRDRVTRDRLLDADAMDLSEASRRVIRSRVNALVEAAGRHALIEGFDFRLLSRPSVNEVGDHGIRDLSGRIIFGGRYRSFVECLEAAVRAGVQLARTDLSGMELSGARLEELDLVGVRMVGAQLDHASFAGSMLARADLSLATGQDVRFDRAEMASVDLSSAVITSSSFVGTRLPHAILTLGNFRQSVFDRADLRRVVARVAVFDRASFAGARLEEADLRATSLEHADLSHVSGRRLVLASARASGIVATGADLTHLDATGADLSGAQFNGARLGDAIFVVARIGASSIDPRTARGADFSGASEQTSRSWQSEESRADLAPSSRVA